jgi:type I restriction enzyme S subunit
METYSTYKDSGIEWIGEIPAHWEIVPIKYSLKIPLTDGPHETPKLHQSGIPFISAESIKKDKIDFSKKRGFISEEEHQRFSLKYKPQLGDVYMIKSGATTGNLARVETDREFNIWSPLAAFRPAQEKTTTDFLFFYMKSSRFFSAVELGWNYGTQQNIGMNVLENLKMVRPPLSEQNAIAKYLDRKTVEIDQLIQDKKRLIKFYQEEKTAIIKQVVTKGLNQNVNLKDSCNEWLGEIPEHWEIKKLNWCFKTIGSGTTPKADKQEYYFNGIHNWLLTGDLNDGEIHKTSKKITDKALEDYSSLKEYPINSIVIAMYGATIGKLGILKTPTTVNQACCVFTNPTLLNYKFAFYILLSAREEIINMSYGGGQPNISQLLLRQFKIQVPPKSEQTSIVEYIELESQRIDAKIKRAKKHVKLLTEYRTAIISEMVTGKIKVIDKK